MSRSGSSRFLPKILLCTVALSLSGFSLPAAAQSSQEILNRLNRLETEISTLNRAVYRGETPVKAGNPVGSVQAESLSNKDLATIENRLLQMEKEIQTLTGTIEEQAFTIRKLEDQLESQPAARTPVQQQPVAQRMPQPVEQQPTYNNTTFNGDQRRPDIPSYVLKGPARDKDNPTQAQPQAQPVPEKSVSVASNADPINLYQRAFSLLREKNFDEAEQMFSTFVQRFPEHNLVSNAKYWLGETYYVRNNYEQAARIFAEGYQKHPEGSKAPDNLLKLGMSLAHMGNTSDACLTFKQLQTKYPDGAGPVLNRAQRELDRLSCGN